MALTLIERARAYVSKMPAAVSGQNGHVATFHVACVLVQGFGLTPSQAMPLLEEYNERCEPPWTERELEHKLDGADKAFARQQKSRGYLAKGLKFIPSTEYREKHGITLPNKPKFDDSALRKFAGDWAGKVNLLWLAARSAEDPCVVTSGRYLETLYGARPQKDLFSVASGRGEKVVIFTNIKSQGQALWPDEPIPETGKNGVWHSAQPVDGNYRPNPRNIRDQCASCHEYRPYSHAKLSVALRAKAKCVCGGQFVPTPQMSRRSEESVIAWRYLLIESDEAPAFLWLALLVQLPLKIVSICSSGSRSIHALVRIDARTRGEWDAEAASMKRTLVTLGADSQAMTAIKQPRLPGCYREGKMIKEMGRDGKQHERYVRFPAPVLQKLLYINPDPPMRPISELAPRRDVLAPWLRWASAGIADSDETNGEALTRALHYYAPVSEECRNALRRLHHR